MGWGVVILILQKKTRGGLADHRKKAEPVSNIILDLLLVMIITISTQDK